MDTLLKILWELHPDINFTEDTRLLEEGGLDSFDIVTLVSEIEDAFGAVIRAQDLIPENFQTPKTLLALIRRLRED